MERNRFGYVFRLAGTRALFDALADLLEDTAARRVETDDAKVVRFRDLRYGARRCNVERRVVARIKATARGCDSRFIVADLTGAPRLLYDELYCGHDEMENRMYERPPPCKRDPRRFDMTLSAAPLYLASSDLDEIRGSVRVYQAELEARRFSRVRPIPVRSLMISR